MLPFYASFIPGIFTMNTTLINLAPIAIIVIGFIAQFALNKDLLQSTTD